MAVFYCRAISATAIMRLPTALEQIIRNHIRLRMLSKKQIAVVTGLHKLDKAVGHRTVFDVVHRVN